MNITVGSSNFFAIANQLELDITYISAHDCSSVLISKAMTVKFLIYQSIIVLPSLTWGLEAILQPL